MRWGFRHKVASPAATEADALQMALERQRALLMGLRDDVDDDGAAERTRRYVRDRARAEMDRRKGVGGWLHGRAWVYGGVSAVVAVVVIAALLLPEVVTAPADLMPETLLASSAARRYPEPPSELRNPGRSRPDRSHVAYVSRQHRRRGETEVAVEGGAPAQGWQHAMNQVTEISVETGGSRRLRLRSQNPKVVIYLLESEMVEGATKEDGGE